VSQRASFAARFPRDPALDALLDAFDRGDFAAVKRGANAIALGDASDDVKKAAREVLARTRPDPLSALFFGLAGALLVFLSIYWWWRTRAS
jgi:hypothetical protein